MNSETIYLFAGAAVLLSAIQYFMRRSVARSRAEEVDWNEMPTGGAVDIEPLMDRLAEAQLDILRRVSAGEIAFYAPRPNEEGAEGFDSFVEHIFALKQRGMLLHGTPVEDGRPGRGLYSSVGSISITPQGRKWLESQA